MNPDDLRDLGALRHDLDAAVPQHLEEKVVWAFRVHHALTALRDDDRLAVPPSLEAGLLGAFREHQARANRRSSSPGRFAWHLGRAAVLVAAAVAAVWVRACRASAGNRSRSPDPGSVAAVIALVASRPRLRRRAGVRRGTCQWERAASSRAAAGRRGGVRYRHARSPAPRVAASRAARGAA